MTNDHAIRAECRRLIQAAARELGETEQTLWSLTYRRFSAAHRAQYVERARNTRRPTIEIVQMDGKLPDLLAMIQHHYGEVAGRSTSPDVPIGRRALLVPRRGEYLEPWEGDDDSRF